MQKVKDYNNYFEAKVDMNNHIREGWRVHTCAMGSYMAGYFGKDHILVVYEK